MGYYDEFGDAYNQHLRARRVLMLEPCVGTMVL